MVRRVWTRKVVTARCAICGRTFQKYVRGLRQRPSSIYARPTTARTCSKPCARKFRIIKK